MIDQLRTMAIFQTVAELGSFRQAAKKLRLSPSVISHHISKLEQDLGAPLLYRSTRRISLTDAGAALFTASQRMTAAAIDGLSAVQRRASHPTGTLTIAASTPFSHSPYVETFTRFAQTYPDVHLSIQLDDRSIPLEGTNIDVAIRGRIDDGFLCLRGTVICPRQALTPVHGRLGGLGLDTKPADALVSICNLGRWNSSRSNTEESGLVQ